MQELKTTSVAGSREPAGPQTPVMASGRGQNGQADRSVTVMAAAGVTILTCLGWVLSYTALRQLALSAGVAAWAAHCGRFAWTCSCSWPRWRQSLTGGGADRPRLPGAASLDPQSIRVV